jgi:SAM-dependent methyltransferase
MAQQPWFRDWFNSPYYHLLYFERNEAEARAFIDRLVNMLMPAPGSRILDIACGRGRHSLVMAEKGYDVTGIDISPAMIDEAKKLERENLHFYVHDMRLPFRINYFNYVFNFFTSFGYFNTRREHEDALRTMSSALKPGGCLVLDYLNVHYVEDHLVHKEKKEMNGVVFYITRWMDEYHFYKKIEIEDETLKEPLEYTEKVSKFSLGDFKDMLAYHGIQLQEVYGDYKLAPYQLHQSPRLILLGRKKESPVNRL